MPIVLTLPDAIFLFGLYALTSMVAFGLYGFDKSAARQGQRRISENTLLLYALIGGWPGSILGQKRFRHKTVKQPFRSMFWCAVILNLGIVAWLVSPYGSVYLSMLTEYTVSAFRFLTRNF